ncbi:hypothetical protein EYF80_048398 [Liparis tanakae]|uniref:Uncharacterized protein n=1 Tax=Liparis tanakae TaxID=230148 RepID=A0A4Z2FJP9_9TELE|nr:hypothetical protein EYF80_048398 [Liparis tanakae]
MVPPTVPLTGASTASIDHHPADNNTTTYGSSASAMFGHLCAFEGRRRPFSPFACTDVTTGVYWIVFTAS